MTPGFLLTRQWVDDRDGVRLDFWLATAQGPMPVSIHRQQALFFIRQADAATITDLLVSIRGVSIKPLQLLTFPPLTWNRPSLIRALPGQRRFAVTSIAAQEAN